MWLQRTHDIDAAIPVENIELEDTEELVRKLFGELIGKVLFSERLRLDGWFRSGTLIFRME